MLADEKKPADTLASMQYVSMYVLVWYKATLVPEYHIEGEAMMLVDLYVTGIVSKV